MPQLPSSWSSKQICRSPTNAKFTWAAPPNAPCVARQRFEADRLCQPVDYGAETLIEADPARVFVDGMRHARNRLEAGQRREARRAGRIVWEDQADGIRLGRESIAARAWQPLDEPFRTQLGEIEAPRAETLPFYGTAQDGGEMRMDFLWC
jgi:hypothetical protein